MRPAVLVLTTLVALTARASENDRLRGAGKPKPIPADVGRGGSGDGCSGACDLLLICLDLSNGCTCVAPSEPHHVVVHDAPPAAPEPDEPIRVGLTVSLGRPITEATTWTPRIEGFIDLPIQRRAAIRLAVDHISLLQQE